ncbi:MAG: insulinase family protein [Acholeplasma sp.]
MIFLPTKQYQAIHISFYFIDKIESDAFLYRFLLARILTSYTNTYMSKQKLSKKLNALYGMFITNHVFVLKDYHIMRFNFVFPNPVFLDDDQMLDDIIQIIKEMFFDRPLFKQSIFDEAKRYTLNEIRSKKDHKFDYAKDQLMHHIFLDHPYGKPITGTLDEVLNVSLTEIYDYYQNYLLNNQINIYVSGHITDDIKHKLNVLSTYERQKHIEPMMLDHMHRPIQNYSEQLSMGQAYIFFAYHLNIDRKHPLYIAALLANTLIAGYPESVLYKLLRETYFIAYDVESKYEYDRSYLILYAGVNLESKTLAYNLIIETVNNFIFDGPSNERLAEAKDYLKNEIYSALDFQDSMIPKQFIADLLGFEETVDDIMLKIDQVTQNEILEVLSMLRLTTTYTLSGADSYEV